VSSHNRTASHLVYLVIFEKEDENLYFTDRKDASRVVHAAESRKERVLGPYTVIKPHGLHWHRAPNTKGQMASKYTG
jgi:hypothetical protein